MIKDDPMALNSYDMASNVVIVERKINTKGKLESLVRGQIL